MQYYFYSILIFKPQERGTTCKPPTIIGHTHTTSPLGKVNKNVKEVGGVTGSPLLLKSTYHVQFIIRSFKYAYY